MDALDFIKSPKVDGVTLVRSKSNKVKGTLFLTATHIIFVEDKTRQETFTLYMVVHNVKAKKKLKTGVYPIIINCKNFQTLEYHIPREIDAIHVQDSISHFSFPDNLEDLYAFVYRPEYDSDVDGWKFYDVKAEFKRFGVPNEQWDATHVNSGYDVCPTYTRHLYAPSALSPSTIAGSAKYRSKGRFPVLSYLYKGKTAICRCAQPMAGVANRRSKDDELLIQAVFEANPSKKKVVIVDTRPKLNAVANKAKGKGFEIMAGYPNAELVFHGIENIHAMRNSLDKLRAVVKESDSTQSFLSEMESCGWLAHIRAVLDTTTKIVKYVVAGHSVVIHCSDGWDRTAQTCSLAGFMLEPYYRTIRGFIVLVEKEWLGFGHKMSDRNQFVSGKSGEVSPIFLQFLECTWQISQQYPRAFEFNELFLISMYDCMVSSQFGTYLCNAEKERRDKKLKQRTHSVWSYLYSRQDEFLNPLYDIGEPAHQAYLYPELGHQHYKLWTSMYCRFDPDAQPRQNWVTAVGHMSMSTELHKKRLEITALKMAAAKEKLEKVRAARQRIADGGSAEDPKIAAAAAAAEAEAEAAEAAETAAAAEAEAAAEANAAAEAAKEAAEKSSSSSSSGGGSGGAAAGSDGDAVDTDPLTAAAAAVAAATPSPDPEIQTRPRRRGSQKEELELAKKASIASALDDDDADEWMIQSPIRTSSGLESSGRVLAKVQSSKDRRESGLETLKGAGAAAIKRSEPVRVIPVEELMQPPPLQSIVGADSCNTPGCKPFEYLSHRQPCLSCGKIFCSACTNKHLANPLMKFESPIPTCNSCAKEIKNANALAAKAAAAAVAAAAAELEAEKK